MSEKKMIESLTPEQEAMIQVYVDKYTKAVNSCGYRDVYKRDSVTKLMEWTYEYSGYKRPVVILAENPYEAHMINQALYRIYDVDPKAIDDCYECEDGDKRETLYQQLLEKVKREMRTTSDGNYADNYVFTADVFTNVLLAWWGYMIEVLGLESEVNEIFLHWRSLYENAGVYNAICNDKVCITSNYPLEIHRNETGELHRTDGQAVIWSGMDFKCYFINGRNIDEEKYEMALRGEVTREIYQGETNEDIRAAWYEILGQEKMLEILEAELIDTGVFVHNTGETEEVKLYKTKGTYPETGDNPYAWVRFVCPSTGTNYLIDVDPRYSTAVEAAVSTCPFDINPEDYKFDGRA